MDNLPKGWAFYLFLFVLAIVLLKKYFKDSFFVNMLILIGVIFLFYILWVFIIKGFITSWLLNYTDNISNQFLNLFSSTNKLSPDAISPSQDVSGILK